MTATKLKKKQRNDQFCPTLKDMGYSSHRECIKHEAGAHGIKTWVKERHMKKERKKELAANPEMDWENEMEQQWGYK